jgi:tRNA (guanine37-N1)-methyltransferase
LSCSGTEHERIVNLLKPKDIVFDVCAGIGPFSVPASMLGCSVYANDINPECFKWININLKKNEPKKSIAIYQVWNLDGREFLQSVAFPRIAQYESDADDDSQTRKIVMLMNLPALALTFFNVFSSWLSNESESMANWRMPVHIYCYSFSNGEDREDDIRTRLATIAPNIDPEQISCRFVRQVAPNKDMMCVRVDLLKRQCVSANKRFKAEVSK